MLPGAAKCLRLGVGIIRRKCCQILIRQQARVCTWLWLDNLFNRIDHDRLRKVGPDRSCAEWLIKNGAAIKLRSQTDWITDYNNLPPDDSDLVKDELVEIYAENSSITSIGFEHFKGCNHVRKVSFIACRLLNNSALTKLRYIKSSLNYLEIRSCPTIMDDGVLSLTQLSNLQHLVLQDLRGVEDRSRCEITLKGALGGASIYINL